MSLLEPSHSLDEPAVSNPNQAEILSPEQRATQQTAHFISLASKLFSTVFKLPELSFNLRGKTAGLFRYHVDGSREIRYNRQILHGQPEAFVTRTVPHEVAHLVAYELHGTGIRPHGREWQEIMGLFGAEPSRCHDYDLSQVSVRQYRRFSYQCGCREHQLTSIRHHRVQSGTQYVCRQCHQPLISNES